MQRLDLLEDVRTHIVHGIARNEGDLIHPQRALAGDENREPRQEAKYFLLPDGKVGRAYVIHETIVVSRFGGKVIHRYSCEERVGPFTAGKSGIWACVGRNLCHFSFSK